MDNNMFPYIQTSKLSISQIRCLSELVLFDFTIKYRTGKSSEAVEALNWYLLNPDSSLERNTDSDEVEVISYSSVCKAVELHLNST